MATTLDYVKAQLPDYADTYVKDMLSQTQAYTDVNANPYQQYQGDRVADFSPLQQTAFQNAQMMQPSMYGDQGAGIANLAAYQALNAGQQFQPGQFQNQYQQTGPYMGQETRNMYDPAQQYQAAQGQNVYQSQGPYQFQQAQNQFQGTGQYDPQGFQNQFRYAQNYDPRQDSFQNQFRDPGSYQSSQITTDKFGQPQADAYMSPYMQSVVQKQQEDAQRQSDIAGTQRNAQAVKAGAFGGSRQAIERAEAARNLAEQKGDIQAKGLQDAFSQAQAQFNADQGRGLTAQQATEQSRQFGAGQGLQAASLGAQYGTAAQQSGAQARQFAANLGLQGAMGEAQYGTAAQQAAMADRQFAQQQAMQNAQTRAQYGLSSDQLNAQQQQFGYGQGMTNAQLAAQYGLAGLNFGEQSRQFGANYGLQNQQNMAQYGLAGATLSQADRQYAQQQAMQNAQNYAQYGAQAAQLGEQSRQYGAGLGLQGAGVANTSASTLGTLGNQQFNQAKDISGLQYLYGTAQQSRNQALNDINYQNFMAAQQYPQQMLSFRSGMLNGLPMGGSAGQTTTPDAPNYGNQILGGLMSWGSSLFAEGGAVEEDDPGIMALMASKYA